jgi:hypothetical protein
MAHQRRETAAAAHELASAQGGGGGPTDLPDDGQISLINSHRLISLVRLPTAPNRLRQKANFLSGIKPIGISSPVLKILLSENRKLWYVSPIPPS